MATVATPGRKRFSIAVLILFAGMMTSASQCPRATAPTQEVSATPPPVPVPPPPAPPYIDGRILTVVNGRNYFDALEVVHVCTDATCGTPVQNATVSVNGGLLALNTAAEYGAHSNEYIGNVAILPGSTFNLSVGVNGVNYTASATQYAQNQFPVLTAPQGGATWFIDGPNVVTWTAAPAPAGSVYFAGVRDDSGKGAWPPGKQSKPGGNSLELPTNSGNSYTVPANSITVSPGSYFVYAGIGTAGIGNSTSPGLPIPNAAAGSNIVVGGISQFSGVTLKP